MEVNPEERKEYYCLRHATKLAESTSTKKTRSEIKDEIVKLARQLLEPLANRSALLLLGAMKREIDDLDNL